MSKVVPISPEAVPEKSGDDMIVTLRVSQLRVLIREEIAAAMNGNGHAPKASLEKLLDAGEVAQLLGETEQWVYRQAKTKKLPSIKLGKYWKFSPAQLQKWLERKQTP